MRRRKLETYLIGASLILGALVFGFGEDVISPQDRTNDTTSRAKRVIVIDGDTLQVGRRRVRLWGIDSPELASAAGRHARTSLAEHLSGKSVLCRRRGVDHYGRVVARCYLDGHDIADWLVDNGLARDVPKYSDGYYRR